LAGSHQSFVAININAPKVAVSLNFKPFLWVVQKSRTFIRLSRRLNPVLALSRSQQGQSVAPVPTPPSHQLWHQLEEAHEVWRYMQRQQLVNLGDAMLQQKRDMSIY
jgi:hypothetical protein